jgi:hypothetical protein
MGRVLKMGAGERCEALKVAMIREHFGDAGC